jgi:hypothetical protein
MSKYKLNNVALVIEKIAMSGLEFLNAAGHAGDATMEMTKKNLYLSQAEVAAMMVKALMNAVDADEKVINQSISASLN